ncbi:MAG: molybdopterin-dependent oxidoreductase [Desulfomonilaceae bacterium]
MAYVTRRDFLRLAALMGGASLFAGCSLFPEDARVPEYIKGAPGVDPLETLPGIDNVYTVCGLCAGNCGICCRVAQETLVKIDGSPYHPVSANPHLPFETPLDEAARRSGSVCGVGGSGIQTLYDPFRIARPLKRVGPRGSGKWVALSWNQAIKEILEGGDLFAEGQVAGLREIKRSAEGFKFLVGRADWGALTFVKRFLSGFPGATLVRDREAQISNIARAAAEQTFGPGKGPVDADYRHARVLIGFGDAPLDSGVPLPLLARQIADAKVNGSCLKWVVVDPRLSTSASKADLWVPVIPGKDLALALGTMRSLLDRYSGIVQLPPESLKNNALSRTIEDYAAESGVPVGIMKRMADFLVEGGERSAAIPGAGVLASENGNEAALAIFALNKMVGSVPGSRGLVHRKDAFLDQAYAKAMAGHELKGEAAAATGLSAKALFLWDSDPVYEDPGTSSNLRDRSEVQLIVGIDRQITESTSLADYILPDTTYLERWDVCASPPSLTTEGFGTRRPVVGVVDPKTGKYFPILPETRQMEDILIAFATHLNLSGFGEKGINSSTPLNTGRDYYTWLLSMILGTAKEAGFNISPSPEDLTKVFDRGGIFRSSESSPVVETGRSRVASSTELREPLGPVAYPSASRSDDEFLLITYTLPFHRTARSGINSWLLEVSPENRLVINSQDAAKLKVVQGASVAIETTDGKAHLQCKAQIVPGIRPGIVALAKGFGYREAGVAPQIVDGTAISADKTRGAGANSSVLTVGKAPARVKVRPA